MRFTDAEGRPTRSAPRTSSGRDGSRSMCRHEFPEAERRQYFREYPYAWFGILCEAPPSAPELIYNHSERGLRPDQPAHADPATDVLPVRPRQGPRRLVRRPDLGRAAGPGGGPTGLPAGRGRSPRERCSRSARSSRSRCATGSWCSPATRLTPCRRPAPRASTWRSPTSRCWPTPRAIAARRDRDALDDYADRGARRVWRAQHFSYWMTTMLHRLPDASDFDVRRQLGELTTLVVVLAGRRAYLAEGYTGWPTPSAE